MSEPSRTLRSRSETSADDAARRDGKSAVGWENAAAGKSAARIIDEYYERRYRKYKEMYENGKVTR